MYCRKRTRKCRASSQHAYLPLVRTGREERREHVPLHTPPRTRTHTRTQHTHFVYTYVLLWRTHRSTRTHSDCLRAEVRGYNRQLQALRARVVDTVAVYIAIRVLGVDIARNVSARLQRIDPGGRRGGPEQDGREQREHGSPHLKLKSRLSAVSCNSFVTFRQLTTRPFPPPFPFKRQRDAYREYNAVYVCVCVLFSNCKHARYRRLVSTPAYLGSPHHHLDD